MKDFFDTEIGRWILLLIEFALIGAVILCLYVAIMNVANADTIIEEVWILCEPTGTVNIRSTPGGTVFGGATCGDKVWTDNRQKNGFLHVLELAAEQDSGWISGRYIVYDEPHEVNAVMAICSDGRVACRTWIGGKIKGWVYDGDLVTVYWKSDTWAVTDKGYIMSEFLRMVCGEGGGTDNVVEQNAKQ